MKLKNHPRSKVTTVVANNGASHEVQWILPSKLQGLEVDPTNNNLWKPYEDFANLSIAKRVYQFNERFGLKNS